MKKENVYVPVNGKKQAKQYKAILEGLGEVVREGYFTNTTLLNSHLDFRDNGWILGVSGYKQKTTIKQLIEILVNQKEEPKELEIGKWYKHIDADILVFKKDENGGYGFINGEWCNSIQCSYADKWQPATEQEVKEALVKEAIKRGFKEGAIIDKTGINLNFTHDIFKPILGYTYNSASNILEDICGSGHIFDKGKWAEVKKSILDGKVAIQVNNKRELDLVKANSINRCDPFKCYTYPLCIELDNEFGFNYPIDAKNSGYTIIQFADFAKKIGIKAPVFVMKSEDGVDLYEGDMYWNVYTHHLNNEWILGAKVQSPFADACIKYPTKFKAFHSKQAAEKWIEEQNKPKLKTIALYFGQEAIINLNKSEVRIMDGDKEVSTLSFGDINDLQVEIK